MSRTGVTLEDVILACEKIKKENQTPTIDRVRHILGTGSNSTIAKYLRTWRDEDKPTTKEAKKTEAFKKGYFCAINDLAIALEDIIKKMRSLSYKGKI